MLRGTTGALAFCLALAGCECGEREPAQEAPVTTTLPGSWTEPFDDYLVVHLAGAGERALLAGRVGDVPQLRMIDTDLRLTPLPAIPAPSHYGEWTDLGPVDPFVAVDARDPRRVVLNRGEHQGGSWGLVVSTWLEQGRWEEIESPTDADVGFGVPLLLRGDELFTLESPGGVGGVLWRYARGPQGWAGRQIPLPHGAETDLGWGLTLSGDGARLVVVAAADGGPRQLQVYERGGGGAMTHARAISIPAEPNGIGFLGSYLALGFVSPTQGGDGVWIIDATSGAVVERFAVPPDETNGTLVQELIVAGDRLLVSQLDRVLVLDPSDGRVQCVLATPPREHGRHTYPVAARVGDHVFVSARCVRDAAGKDRSRVGVFDLAVCGD